MVRLVAHVRKRSPLSDLNIFYTAVDISDIITCANCGENRLRGLGVAAVKICPSPLTMIVAVTTLSHCRASV